MSQFYKNTKIQMSWKFAKQTKKMDVCKQSNETFFDIFQTLCDTLYPWMLCLRDKGFLA